MKFIKVSYLSRGEMNVEMIENIEINELKNDWEKFVEEIEDEDYVEEFCNFEIGGGVIYEGRGEEENCMYIDGNIYKEEWNKVNEIMEEGYDNMNEEDFRNYNDRLKDVVDKFW